jgi:prolipoprotein diacylglyceryl transferase
MPMMAFIPSPSTNVIKVGPVPLHVYGFMIALGVVAAVWLCRRRWASWGNDPDFVTDLAYWAVPGGLIGARLYHVATDFNRLYVHNLSGIPKIWDGGLGIPGGIIGGVGVGWWYARRRKQSVVDLLDMVAPALPLAQAIGRFGNYFNQELFGRPTTLPWGLRIDPAHRPSAYVGFATFHPTFVYELLWNLALMAVLLGLDSRRGRGGELGNGVLAAYYGLFAVGFGLDTLLVVQRQTSLAAPVQTALFVAGGIAGAALVWSVTRIGRKGPHRRGDLFLLYLAGYFLGRLWVESLRIDTANLILGLRVNEWTSILAGSAALVGLYVRRRVGGIPPIEPVLERADGGAELVVGAQLPAGAAIALRSSTTDVSSAMPPSR